MPPVGFEPTISAGERPQIYALDRAVTGSGYLNITVAYPFKSYWLRDTPTGLTFNNCALGSRCIYVFRIYLRTNSDLCLLQHKLIGFYNRDEKCLQRGTDWVFK